MLEDACRFDSWSIVEGMEPKMRGTCAHTMTRPKKEQIIIIDSRAGCRLFNAVGLSGVSSCCCNVSGLEAVSAFLLDCYLYTDSIGSVHKKELQCLEL